MLRRERLCVRHFWGLAQTSESDPSVQEAGCNYQHHADIARRAVFFARTVRASEGDPAIQETRYNNQCHTDVSGRVVFLVVPPLQRSKTRQVPF